MQADYDAYVALTHYRLHGEFDQQDPDNSFVSGQSGVKRLIGGRAWARLPSVLRVSETRRPGGSALPSGRNRGAAVTIGQNYVTIYS